MTLALACDADPAARGPAPDAQRVDQRVDAATHDAASLDAGLEDARPIDARPAPDAASDATTIDAGQRDAQRQDADAGPPPGARCDVTGATPLRRLTPIQYENTVRALGLPAIPLDLTDDPGPVISQLGAERFSGAAAALAAAADVSVAGLLPCDPRADEALCAAEFITTFADAAFRRAPTAAELAWLDGVWQAADGDFAARARLIIEVVLQSPQLLYRFETQVDGALTPASRAQRLAYTLTDAPPDAELRAADLSDAAARSRQADRLAHSAAGRARLRRFLVHWAGIERIGHKSAPFDAEAARAESLRFIDTILNEDGTFGDILTRRDAALEPELAALYGTPPGDGDLPADTRAGLLTRLAFLAAHAGPLEKSPIQRGVFVRSQLLCAPLPPPPPTVDNTPIQRGGRADDGRARSIRQFTAIRTAGRDCAGCHDLINPAGFLFEHYDARGRFVRNESGVDRFGEPYTVDVDAAAEILGADFGPHVADAVALSDALADSPQAHDCLATHWLRAALARDLTAQDSCDLNYLQDTFAASGGRLSVLLTATAQLAALRLKHPEQRD